ncbi:MAG TPA: dual specificity protein phosphatase family protein [Planctomycetaceae bacterium]|nr:dual specificity protein phosphatase family protein [Planctomycetaceae bacterium]
MPRPRAGDWLPGEIDSWRRSGLDVVVSLLEDTEVAELNLEQESALCEQAGLEFLRFPIPDRGVPASADEMSALLAFLVKHMRDGRSIGIHCRIGVGRSALVAACVLKSLGLPLEAAWESIEQARGLSVPDTPQQKAWVTRLENFVASEGKARKK